MYLKYTCITFKDAYLLGLSINVHMYKGSDFSKNQIPAKTGPRLVKKMLWWLHLFFLRQLYGQTIGNQEKMWADKWE